MGRDRSYTRRRARPGRPSEPRTTLRPRAAWFRGRARNVLRGPRRLLAVAGAVFTVAVLVLTLVPRQAQRAFSALAPRPEEWRDSTGAIAALARAVAEVEAANAALASARAEAAAPPVQPVPIQPAPTREALRQRDSLRVVVGAIQRELARVERAPLPASYRQLGELPEVVVEPGVRPLLDSLVVVEREREEFAALGGVDPIYVSLTSRVNAIGRSIQGLAERRLAAARQELTALVPPAPPAPVVAERPPVDTLTPLRRVVGAEQAERSARDGLEMVRRTNAALMERAEMARQGANFIAPPLAVFGAALVVALAVGYLWRLAEEMRRPRVADGDELEWETGVRTLAVVTATGSSENHLRRRSDGLLPEVLDPGGEIYRTLYLRISPTGSAIPTVAVTGDDPSVVATVAANLAAAGAAEARETLLVDADLRSGMLTDALQVRTSPGVSELLRGEAAWPDALTSVVSGRDRVVAVIPAGTVRRGEAPPASDHFREEFWRMARRHDLTVVAAPLTDAPVGEGWVVPVADVLLIVRAGVTPLERLRATVAALRGAGLRIQGGVVWDGGSPVFERSVPARRRVREPVS